MILNQQQPSSVPLPRHLTGARVWAVAGACLCVDRLALAASLRSGGCALACARLCARAGARPCARAGARPCGPCRDRESPGPCRDPCPCRDRDRGPCRDRDCGCGAPASPFVFLRAPSLSSSVSRLLLPLLPVLFDFLRSFWSPFLRFPRLLLASRLRRRFCLGRVVSGEVPFRRSSESEGSQLALNDTSPDAFFFVSRLRVFAATAASVPILWDPDDPERLDHKPVSCAASSFAGTSDSESLSPIS